MLAEASFAFAVSLQLVSLACRPSSSAQWTVEIQLGLEDSRSTSLQDRNPPHDPPRASSELSSPSIVLLVVALHLDATQSTTAQAQYPSRACRILCYTSAPEARLLHSHTPDSSLAL